MTTELTLILLFAASCAIVMAMIWRDTRRRGQHTNPGARMGLAMGVAGWILGVAMGVAGALL